MTQSDALWIAPEAKRMLDSIASSGEPPLESLGAAEARRIADERVIRTNMAGEPVASVREVVTPGSGGLVRLRIYSPSPSETLPILLYIHGGGWTVGNLDTHDPQCRRFANRANCMVVSVDYRLSPEHRFPAAVEDVLTAAEWIASEGAQAGGDPQRVAVAGDSSGGTLSATVAQQMRGRSDIRICLQILVYPGTDLRMGSDSYKRLGEGYFLTSTKMRWFIEQYLSSTADADNPLASPLLTADLTGVAPTLLMTAGLDPLLDEGLAYGERLRQAGVAVAHVNYEGWPHGFFFWAQTSASLDANDRIEKSLTAAFAERLTQ